jgi:hypothetical protein
VNDRMRSLLCGRFASAPPLKTGIEKHPMRSSVQTTAVWSSNTAAARANSRSFRETAPLTAHPGPAIGLSHYRAMPTTFPAVTS